MVRWASERADRRKGRTRDRSGSGLGPQGRGIFERLFGHSPRAPDPTRARREALSLAIASGKGGTGKSFVATSLAVLLHRRRLRTTLVDCDFGLACDHLLLGVTPRATLQHLVTGRAALRQVRVHTPCGPALVPGASGVRQMAALSDQELLALGAALGELAAHDDVVLFDVGAGIAPQNVLTLLCADHVVLVTEAEIAALTDAYAVIKCVVQLAPQTRFSVVVNRVRVPGQGERTFEKLADVARRYSQVALAFLGEIPEDPTVTKRRLGQQPLVVSDPDGPIARALAGVLGRLEEVAGPFEDRPVPAGEGLEARFRAHRLFLT